MDTVSALDSLNAQSFSEQLKTQFTINLEGSQPLRIELVEVIERATAPTMESFCLLFNGPAAPRLSQGIVRLEHPKLGILDLFLGPVGLDNAGMIYEAVFNRFRK